jgi:hypothetical protein
VTGWWFSPGTLVSSTDITEMLLKVALDTIKPMNILYIRKNSGFVALLSKKYSF